MAHNLFLSYRLDALVDQLLHQIQKNPIDPLTTRTIVVPNSHIRQWLLLEIAKRQGIAMGLKIVEIEQLIPPSLSSLEMFCLIYGALTESDDPQLLSYFLGKKGRLLSLTSQLSQLFYKYGQFAPHLFKEKLPHWQHQIVQKLFIDGPWKLPVQQEVQIGEPIICFGIDFLPPVYWEALFRAPSLSVYLFSPCIDFWADLSSDRERRSLHRYWKKRSVSKKSLEQLDAYLREAPKNLANWGKLGRETLKIFDRFDLDTEEAYPSLEPNCLLKQIQFDLLTFQETEKPKIDDSIRVILTGSSRLKEIEALKEEILRLNIPYHEISVLAPDIEPYVPLIEFVFSNEIPYRISGLDAAPQSSFRQGLIRLLRLASGRWDAKEILTLFETPAFYRKQGWDTEILEGYRSWIAKAEIEWGLDGDHRKSILQEMLGDRPYEDGSSWEKGLDRLLDAIVFFKPFQVDPDRFETLIEILSLLKNLDFKGEKTLISWASSLEMAVETFLLPDLENEADIAAKNCFRQLLIDLRNFKDERLYPSEVIEHLLIRPCKVQIHASYLHAVQFAPLEEGASIPAKALFLIGMDEESFPRIPASTSLDLLKQKIPDRADRDRYLFLQTIFSAREFLRISYGHLSPDEGKAVGPSPLVQELLSVTGSEIITHYRGIELPSYKKSFVWPPFKKTELPEGEYTVSLSDLRQLASHPWKFFLQKVYGIYLDNELKETFALQKGKLLRSQLGKQFLEGKLPPGLFGKAMELEVLEKASKWQMQLDEWQLKPFSLVLNESCSTPQWEGDHYTAPPIELTWDNLTVRIVGEARQATLKGVICANDDTLSGVLKIWPEALAVALSLNAPQLWMLKNGKTKQLENPAESLKGFIEYYFHSLNAPSPLVPDWVDSILRKGAKELEKKMEKGSLFEDPTLEWVSACAELPCAQEIYSNWAPFLQEAFSGLLQIYPLTKRAKEVF